jgi:hypothetical protein
MQQLFRNRRSRKKSCKLNFEQLESKRLLAITVDTLIDEEDFSVVDGDVSLRDAIGQAADGETINFAAGLDGGTVALTLGRLEINQTLVIDASSLTSGLTVDGTLNDATPLLDDGNGESVFFIFPSSGGVEFDGLTVTGGDTSGAGGGIGLGRARRAQHCNSLLCEPL